MAKFTIYKNRLFLFFLTFISTKACAIVTFSLEKPGKTNPIVVSLLLQYFDSTAVVNMIIIETNYKTIFFQYIDHRIFEQSIFFLFNVGDILQSI